MLRISRFTMPGRTAGLALGSLVALGLAACSQDNSSSSDSADTAATTEPAVYVFDRPPVPPSPPASDVLGRGEYLVESIVGCGNCHDGRDDSGALVPGLEYAGNFVIAEEGFTAYAPNITPDPETGIGNWTDAEVERAIRQGIAKDGHIMGPPMAFPYYNGISTDDMAAIIAYIRSRPAVHREVPKSNYDIPLPPSWGDAPTGRIEAPPRSDEVAYGHYLAHNLGHCTQCHTPLVNGVEDFSRTGAGMNIYPMPFGYPWSAISANITSDPEVGLGAWTDDEIKRAITMGISRDGRMLLPFMAFSFYDKISDEDLDAIVAYLRSLPPTRANPPAVEGD